MKGRKPTPTPLKLLHGNPGKRPVNKDEPVSELLPADYPPPDHIDGIARDCWVQMVALLSGSRVITELDLHSLELYCTSYKTYREAQDSIAKTGPIVKSPKSGYPVQSPFFAIANKAHEQMVKLAAEFGLTPSSRSRVKTVSAPKKANKFL